MAPIAKRVSKKLQKLIDEANSTFGRAKGLVAKAYRLALSEGYSPQEAKALLIDKITLFSQRTIYSYLPDEAKDQSQRNRRLGHPTRNPVANLQPIVSEGNQAVESATILSKEAAEQVIRDTRETIIPSEPEAGSAVTSPAPDRSKDEKLAAQAIEIKNLHAALAEIHGNIESVPAVKELRHELLHERDRNAQLSEVIREQGVGFQKATVVAESRRKVMMNKKFVGSIFQINANYGKVLDYDIELITEGDRVAEINNKPIMKQEMKA